jgi:hypothetical protein
MFSELYGARTGGGGAHSHATLICMLISIASQIFMMFK